MLAWPNIGQIDREREVVSARLQELAGIALPPWPRRLPRAKAYLRIDRLKAEAPVGPLFYPCCGSDIEEPLRIFGQCVSIAHFADPYKPSASDDVLPHLNEGSLPCHLIEPIGNVVTGVNRKHETVIGSHNAVIHQADGLTTLIRDAGPVAVFCHRGDSKGEGGSDQRWTGAVLMDVVLSRMLDGGLICTDRAHYEYNVLFGPRGRPDVGEEIRYRKVVLKCIVNDLKWKNGDDCAVWQVKPSRVARRARNLSGH